MNVKMLLAVLLLAGIGTMVLLFRHEEIRIRHFDSVDLENMRLAGEGWEELNRTREFLNLEFKLKGRTEVSVNQGGITQNYSLYTEDFGDYNLLKPLFQIFQKGVVNYASMDENAFCFVWSEEDEIAETSSTYKVRYYRGGDCAQRAKNNKMRLESTDSPLFHEEKKMVDLGDCWYYTESHTEPLLEWEYR